MKPKERFLNYALLSSTASCEPVPNTHSVASFKETGDNPIDLSCKPHTRTLSNHHDSSVLDPRTLEHIIKTGTLPFTVDPSPPTSLSYHSANPLPVSQASEAPWPIKYCYPSPTPATNPTSGLMHGYPHPMPNPGNGAVFPYMLLSPHHLHHQSSVVHHPSSTPIIHRPEIESPISVFPYHHRLTSADHFALYNARQQLENHRLHQAEELASTGAGSAHSPPSSAASPSDLYRNNDSNSREHPSLIRSKSSESPPVISAFRAPPPANDKPIIILKRSQSASPTCIPRASLKKSNSYPNLPKYLSRPIPAGRILAKRLHKPTTLRRTKSEDCLHKIKSLNIPTRITTMPAMTTIPSPPQTTFNPSPFVKSVQQKRLSDCEDKSHEFEKENNIVVQQSSPKSRFHRHFRKEVIESWDNENKQANANTNALDLTHSSPPLKKLSSDMNSLDSFSDKVHSPDSPMHSDVKEPMPLSMDIYRQYYYYLMQEPAFASRAAAVAMAETYAKLLSPPRNGEMIGNHLSDKMNMNMNICDNIENAKAFTNVQMNNDVQLKSPPISPDFVMNINGKTELRSADTTMNGGLACFDRKRISRPLTGKHVRHGTGASPATLVGLRNMIQQRQKLREIGRMDQNNRFGKAKNNKRIKRK